MRAIQLYAAAVADAVLEGKSSVPQVAVGEDEFVELDEEGNPRRKRGKPGRAQPGRGRAQEAPGTAPPGRGPAAAAAGASADAAVDAAIDAEIEEGAEAVADLDERPPRQRRWASSAAAPGYRAPAAQWRG